MRRRRSAGLTYFFFPRGEVGERRPDRRVVELVCFVEVVVCLAEVDDAFLPEDCGLLAVDLCFVGTGASAPCPSYRFPSI